MSIMDIIIGFGVGVVVAVGLVTYIILYLVKYYSELLDKKTTPVEDKNQLDFEFVED